MQRRKNQQKEYKAMLLSNMHTKDVKTSLVQQRRLAASENF